MKKMSEYKRRTKGTKLGSGKRFAVMTDILKKRGAKNPKALAAWIGRKKLGKAKFQKLASAGRRKHSGYQYGK